MNITKKLKEEHNIKISAAMLMYIANTLQERQFAIFRSLAGALMDGESNDKIEQLDEMAMANEVVGQKIMDCIEEAVGEELFEKFVDGKLNIDGKHDNETSIVMPETSTLN